MQNKIDEINRTLQRTDYGESYEYYGLHGECYDYKQNQYIYTMCPYGKATQKEGNSNVNLGTWNSIEYNNNTHTTKFIFNNGATCWNGPARSLHVLVECGIENVAYSVEEPSKCVYEMKFMTPAACHENDIEYIKQQLYIAEHGDD